MSFLALNEFLYSRLVKFPQYVIDNNVVVVESINGRRADCSI